MQNVRADDHLGHRHPTSIISTFAAMDFAGITLNAPSMLGLTLSVGIVIDDAIVVLETSSATSRRRVSSPSRRRSRRPVRSPGGHGDNALTVVISCRRLHAEHPWAILQERGVDHVVRDHVSLLVSFTLTPMLSARLLQRLKRKSEEDSPEGGAPKRREVIVVHGFWIAGTPEFSRFAASSLARGPLIAILVSARR